MKLSRRGSRSLLVIAVISIATAGFSTPAEASDDHPCEPQEGVTWSVEAVQLCPLTSPLSPNGWVPVYAQPVASPAAPTSWLHGTSDQRFVCQARFPQATYYHPERGWFNDWWAYTLSDDRVWGWVPEVFFAGGADDEQDIGLRVCEPASPSAPPAPGSQSAESAPAAPGAAQAAPHKRRRRRRRATLALHAKRHFFRNGQILRLSGHLNSHLRPRGILVVIEAEVGESWQPFGTASTVRGGCFSYRYRFHSTTGVQRYRLRAKVPAQRGYQFRSGASNVVSVRVSGTAN